MATDNVNFAKISSLAQMMKEQIRTGTRWENLRPEGKEAFDQILTAIARTCFDDGAHWDAIAGCAQAAKPSEPAPTVEPVRSQVEGLRAIERSFRDVARSEIPARNDHG